jgi:hypothetical protein
MTSGMRRLSVGALILVIIVYLAIIQLVGRAASIGLDADYAPPTPPNRCGGR